METLQTLKGTELFSDLDDKILKELAESAHTVELKSGMVLYEEGEEGDALYLVANGRLSVSKNDALTSEEQRLAELGRNEIVGELALITGEKRSVTVRAIRDSGLIKISKQQFSELLAKHPVAAMRVTNHIIDRLRRPLAKQARDAMRSSRTMAVIPAHEGLPYKAFARGLADALGMEGSSLKLDSERVNAALGKDYAATVFEDAERNEKLYSWLNALERQYRYIVYESAEEPGAWTRRCMRQADRVLLLVDARRQPEVTPIIQSIIDNDIKAPIEVVLIHEDDYHGGTVPFAWRSFVKSRRHHQHFGGYDGQSLAHIARMISGRALGLVLAGGGARGFAHLGLIRALEERNIAVDLVGGASFGALVAALCAMGKSFDELLHLMRETFVDNNYLNDYSLSRVSLIRGKKLLARLEELMGELCIEQLARQFYCVSTNLTRDELVVHERGRLSDWVGVSMSVPGIAPPFVYNGELLVDGGLLNNLPIDVMSDYGRGPVLASDVSSKTELRVDSGEGGRPYQLFRSRSESGKLNMFNILYQTATMTGEKAVNRQIEYADIYLDMPVDDIGMFDWERKDEIIYRGYHHATETLDQYLESGLLLGGQTSDF